MIVELLTLYIKLYEHAINTGQLISLKVTLGTLKAMLSLIE